MKRVGIFYRMQHTGFPGLSQRTVSVLRDGFARRVAPALVLLCLLAAPLSARQTILQFNGRTCPPNLDVLWEITITGNYSEVVAQPQGLVLTATKGDFSLDQIQMTPIGGKDRPTITISPFKAPFWTTRFDPFGVVTEITLRQEVQIQGSEAKTVLIPVAVQLLEQHIEPRIVVSEIRNMRVTGTQESHALEYLFVPAFLGTYSKTDVNFFARTDLLVSRSGRTNRRGDIQIIKETLHARTTLLLPEIRLSLMGANPEDREGMYRLTLIGHDTAGNIVTAQCDVPLVPAWSKSASPTPAAPSVPPPAPAF
jgi:hypothetical protein